MLYMRGMVKANNLKLKQQRIFWGWVIHWDRTILLRGDSKPHAKPSQTRTLHAAIGSRRYSALLPKKIHALLKCLRSTNTMNLDDVRCVQ